MQKTITISFDAQEPSQTLKGSLLEQIATFNKNEELAKKQKVQRVKDLKTISREVMAQLNKDVGEDVWFVRERDKNTYFPELKRNHINRDKGIAFGVSIKFDDGIRRNTPYDDWELIFQSPTRKEVLGQLNYLQPNLDVIEMYLVGNNQNKGKIILINDVSEIHKHLEKDYLTYFTKSK